MSLAPTLAKNAKVVDTLQQSDPHKGRWASASRNCAVPAGRVPLTP